MSVPKLDASANAKALWYGWVSDTSFCVVRFVFMKYVLIFPRQTKDSMEGLLEGDRKWHGSMGIHIHVHVEFGLHTY